MKKDAPPDRGGLPVIPITLALVVAAGALAGLFFYAPNPAPAPAVGPVAAVVPNEDEDDGIQTMPGLPGYGSYDGIAFSDRAKELAEKQDTATLLARVQSVPAEAQGGIHADYAAALALKQEKSEGDQASILAAMEVLSQHRDPKLRRMALWTLAGRGNDGLAAMGRSLERLTESNADPQAQVDLIGAIGKLAPEADRAIELLSNRVRYSANPTVRQSAAETLAHMGPAAQLSLRNVMSELRFDKMTNAQNDEVLERLNTLLGQLDQIEGFERP